MKNKKFLYLLILNILVFGLFVFFVVEYSLSFGIYSDEYGTEVYSDTDWLVLTLSSLILLVYGISSLLRIKASKNISIQALYVTCIIISAIFAFYPLGTFTKAMVKGKEYLPNQWYLYTGILGLIMLCISLLSAYRTYKTYNKNKASQ